MDNILLLKDTFHYHTIFLAHTVLLSYKCGISRNLYYLALFSCRAGAFGRIPILAGHNKTFR